MRIQDLDFIDSTVRTFNINKFYSFKLSIQTYTIHIYCIFSES